MSALGLSCNVSGGRILVRGVLLRNGTAEEVFHHAVAREEDLALQLRSLSNDLDTRLKDLDVISIVVRSADYHRAMRITDQVALRLRGEGVLLSTARAHTDQVTCLSGRAIGEQCGTFKEAVRERALALLPAALEEATSAALAADQLLGPNSSHS